LPFCAALGITENLLHSTYTRLERLAAGKCAKPFTELHMPLNTETTTNALVSGRQYLQSNDYKYAASAGDF